MLRSTKSLAVPLDSAHGIDHLAPDGGWLIAGATVLSAGRQTAPKAMH
jgi:hypothetical protein